MHFQQSSGSSGVNLSKQLHYQWRAYVQLVLLERKANGTEFSIITRICVQLNLLFRRWGFHDCEYEDCHLPVYDTVNFVVYRHSGRTSCFSVELRCFSKQGSKWISVEIFWSARQMLTDGLQINNSNTFLFILPFLKETSYVQCITYTVFKNCNSFCGIYRDLIFNAMFII
jgi:hypothetical protein